MSMLVNPYWLTPPLTEGTLALAEYTGSDGDTSDPVPFAGEVYDTGGFWNSGSNTTLSIPAGRSGLIRYQFSQYSVDGSLYYAQEESTSVSARGYVHKATGVSLSESGGGGMSAPIAVTGGEDFELSLKSGSTDTDFCWHSIEVLDPDMSRALAYLTSGQTISAADTWEVISWDATETDTDSFWSGGSPTRLTVPATGIYRVVICMTTASSTGQQDYRCTINGSAAPGMILTSNNARISNVARTPGCSAPLSLTSGDYIEIWQKSTTAAGGVTPSNYTWVSIERLSDSLPYCFARKTNAQNADNTSPVVTFDTEVHDPLGMFSPTSGTFTMPSGYSYARAIGNIGMGANSHLATEATFSHDNSGKSYWVTGATSAAGGSLNFATAWVPLSGSGGEVVNMNAFATTTEAINAGGNVTWFAVELKA